MEKMVINETIKTPGVVLSPEGQISIKGRSITENAHSFYKPLFDDWLDLYLEQPKQTTTVNISLEYYNTSSSMWILRLLKRIEQLKEEKNKDVVINWYYPDEDIYDSGLDYQGLISIPFNMIEIDEENFD